LVETDDEIIIPKSEMSSTKVYTQSMVTPELSHIVDDE